MTQSIPAHFPPLNHGYARTFAPGHLSLGLVVPIESYPRRAVPALTEHLQRVRHAEALGFAAVWLRDIPFVVPSFGDAGQVFDPFVYLGALAASTDDIALGVASVILPLRHPAHVAKASASADVLSGGRVLLGIASGDRPEEYPALAATYQDRGARFREAVAYIDALFRDGTHLESSYGQLDGRLRMLPKPSGGRVPLLITGGSQQTPEWIAGHGDGWMTYPRPPAAQARVVDAYAQRLREASAPPKPVMQSLYVDVEDDADAAPRPIHLGFRSGVNPLRAHLRALRDAGVHHVALNLRFNQAPIPDTLDVLADALFPEFGPKESRR